MPSGMLNLHEVKRYLRVDEKHVQDLIRQGKLTAYKIGGTYLRFRKEQVYELKKALPRKTAVGRSFLETVRDFWYFNSFYILSTVAILLLVYWLFK